MGGDWNGALDECCCCSSSGGGADEYGDRGTRADWDDEDDDDGLECAGTVVEASQSDSLPGGYAASPIGLVDASRSRRTEERGQVGGGRGATASSRPSEAGQRVVDQAVHCPDPLASKQQLGKRGVRQRPERGGRRDAVISSSPLNRSHRSERLAGLDTLKMAKGTPAPYEQTGPGPRSR